MTARMPAEVYWAVLDRDNGCCRRCGAAGAEVHHRRSRGAGGTSIWPHGLANLALLCLECHRLVESEREYAYASGWAIRRSEQDDDEQIPLIDAANNRLFLTADGGVIHAGKDIEF